MPKRNKNLLKTLENGEKRLEDTPTEAILRKMVKACLVQGERVTEEQAIEKRKAKKKAILNGDLATGRAAEELFDSNVADQYNSATIKKIKPDAEHGRKFKKTPEEQKQIAKLGGHGKHSKKYNAFIDWIDQTGFDVKSHKDDSNSNFACALKNYRVNGKSLPFTAAPKTADKYRKLYLKEVLG